MWNKGRGPLGARTHYAEVQTLSTTKSCTRPKLRSHQAFQEANCLSGTPVYCSPHPLTKCGLLLQCLASGVRVSAWRQVRVRSVTQNQEEVADIYARTATATNISLIISVTGRWVNSVLADAKSSAQAHVMSGERVWRLTLLPFMKDCQWIKTWPFLKETRAQWAGH